MAKKNPKRRKRPAVTRIPVEQLHAGPIRHKKLNRDDLAVARYTHRKIGRYNCPTMEQWELGFLRDANPRQELAIWLRMAFALDDYCQKHPKANRKTTAALLIKLSCGNEPTTEQEKELHKITLGKIDPARIEKAIASEIKEDETE